MRKRFLRNLTSNYLGFGVNALTVLLLTPFLVRNLGDSQFGAWVLLNSFLAFFPLLEFGIMPSVVRFVSHHLERGEPREVDRVIGTALAAMAVPALAALPLVYLGARFLPPWFNLDPAEATLFAPAFWLAGIAGILSFFKRVLVAVLEGHQRFDLLNLSSASATLLGAATMVFLVLQGFGLLALMAVLLGQTLYETGFGLVVLFKVFGIRPVLDRTRRRHFKKIFGYSYYAYLIDIALNISYRIDTLVIGLFLPVGVITHYSISTRIANLIEKVTDPLIDLFFPLASQLHTAGNPQRLQRLLIRGSQWSMLLAVPPILLVGWHGRDLIGWWVGGRYIETCAPVLYVFLGVIFFSVHESTASRILLGMERVRFNANVSLYAAAVNLGLSLYLVRDYGIMGVALGTFIPSFISKFLIAVPYTCRITGTSLWRFYREVFGPALGIGLPSLVFLMWMDRWDLDPMAGILFNSLVVSAVAGAWMLRFRRTARAESNSV